jgi:hypothetical protein
MLLFQFAIDSAQDARKFVESNKALIYQIIDVYMVINSEF